MRSTSTKPRVGSSLSQDDVTSSCADQVPASGRPCRAASRRSRRRLSRHRRRRCGRRRRRRGKPRHRVPPRAIAERRDAAAELEDAGWSDESTPGDVWPSRKGLTGRGRSYQSDTTSDRMPVGYENSAMKMSFSLSSLQPSSASLESPEQARLRSDRPYNSLTKKPRKDPQQEAWRRSWGSREDNQKEFWATYEYLMDGGLMASCADASGELTADSALRADLATLKAHFTEIYEWLDCVRDGVYGKEEQPADRGLRVSHMEEMRRNSFRRQSFNEMSASLLDRAPGLEEEVAWRVSHLNAKWEMLEQALTPDKNSKSQQQAGGDVEHQVRCLRKWLAEMESRLQPLDFRTIAGWRKQEIDEKTKEHMVLDQDINSHLKIVTSVVKLCESHGTQQRRRRPKNGRRGGVGGVGGGEDLVGVACSLHNRWLKLCLLSVEWTCLFEQLAAKLRNQSPSVQSSDSEEGPAKKYPRLSGNQPRRHTSSASSSSSVDGDLRSDASSWDDEPADALVMDTCAMVEASAASPEMRPGKGKKRRNGKGAETSPRGAAADAAVALASRRQGGDSFNESNREAPNYATFYFKHMDTDSEQDARQQDVPLPPEKPVSGGSGNDKSPDDSSEEEWTFTNGAGKSDSSSEAATSRASHVKKRPVAVQRLDFSEPAPMLVNDNNQNLGGVARKAAWKSSRESIQRLVVRADEMVMTTNMSNKTTSPGVRAIRSFEPLVFGDLKPASFEAKAERTAAWLQRHPHDAVDAVGDPPGDSCDASGEYTTGESDDEKRSSQSEDEVNVSVATCRQGDALLRGCSRSNSSDAILEAEISEDTASPLRTPTHVVLRTRRRQAERPWSVSGLGQLMVDGGGGGGGGNVEQLANFSISESALHEMAIGSPQGKGPALLGSGVMNNSSSTIDGTLMGVEMAGSGSRTGSLRRKKLRIKKRTMGRKSESGSDGVTVGHSNSGGSDSQQSKPIIQSHAVEESPRTSASKIKTKLSSTSDSMLKDSSSDDDERTSRRPLPAFKLGPEGGSVSVRDNKKLGLGVDEHHSHHSALSEQAWDNYQEKYMSEPYSEELADSEAARRLLEFGDDYRNYIDSQSDCASSLGARRAASPARRRRGAGVGVGERPADSDSDLDEIRHVIQQSRAQLEFTEHVFGKQLANASPQLILATDFAEIGATCRENVNCLHLVLDNVEEDDAGLLSAQECRDIRGLVERWELLQVKAEDLQRVRALQKEMVLLKDSLLDLASRVDGVETHLQDRDHLENTINQVKTELSGLRERKTRLLEVNVAVHRFLTDTGHPAAILKDDVADLYRIWDETYHSVSLRLTHLQSVSTALQQFEAHLAELQLTLRADQNTLRMLDSALQGGAVTADVASSVRDVAKVLSEKRERARHDALSQTPKLLESSTGNLTGSTLVLTSTLSTEGSLSDSGISDEGSEQELSERERRLEALRRLARHLETVLAPGSAVLLNMAMRIEQTENELRGLQKTCKELIVRTAVCAESRVTGGVPTSVVTSTPKPKPSPRIRRSSSRRLMLGAQMSVQPDDDDDDPDKSRSWLWRIMRSALPFQMALVALFCVACLLEPHCCDSMNSSYLSFTPQLRYLRGPPPV